MLRIDRNIPPDLPRPAYEISAEAADRSTVRVSIQGETFGRYSEIPLTDHSSTEEGVVRWLRSQTDFALEQSEWNTACDEAAGMISRWCFSEEFEADLGSAAQ